MKTNGSANVFKIQVTVNSSPTQVGSRDTRPKARRKTNRRKTNSKEQIRKLWRRLLAGDGFRQGSVSPSQVQLLSQLFSRLCEFAFESPAGDVFVLNVKPGVHPSTGGEFGERPLYDFQFPSLPKLRSAFVAQGLTEPILRLLVELGLVSTMPGEELLFKREGKPLFEFTMRNGNRALCVQCEDSEYTYLTLPIVRLTYKGRELFRLHHPGVTTELDPCVKVKFDAAIIELFDNVGFRASWQPIPSRAGATAWCNRVLDLLTGCVIPSRLEHPDE